MKCFVFSHGFDDNKSNIYNLCYQVVNIKRLKSEYL